MTSTGGRNRSPRLDVEAQNLIRHDAEGYNKERREQMRHLQKEAFQLANYYFVFQGVIFTSFYNTPSHLKCEYRWFPFALSMIAGVLNLCALSSIACKYKSTLDAIDTSIMTMPAGCGNANNNGCVDEEEPIVVKCERYWRCFYVLGCMLLFLGFFGITLAGCWVISCGGKITP